jgi:Na+(H+)/acetate symporter ActP
VNNLRNLTICRVHLNLVRGISRGERVVPVLFNLTDEVSHLVGVAENFHMCCLVPIPVLIGLLWTEANHRGSTEGTIKRLLKSIHRDRDRNERNEEHSGDNMISFFRKIYFNFFVKGAREQQSNEVDLLQS